MSARAPCAWTPRASSRCCAWTTTRCACNCTAAAPRCASRTPNAAREFEIDTDEGRFLPLEPGSYRIDRADATSTATAWRGSLRYEGNGQAITLDNGQRADFWIEAGSARYNLTAPDRDAFADWVASSEREDERTPVPSYVSPEMTGAEDLGRYGSWQQSPDYGALWIPSVVVAGWAPYRYGHWGFVQPWGWTWIDDAPWGFAPFHYGRWVQFGGRWGWSPGRYVARPVYAPALVAWVGGPRFSVSVSVGSQPSVGWFPLGPREVFVPGYRVSPGYVRNVNVTQVTNITNVTTIINNPNTVVNRTHYINRGVANAVTVVPTSVLTRRQPVAPVALRVADPQALRELTRQPLVQAAPVAAPQPAPRNAGRGAPPSPLAEARVRGPRERPVAPSAESPRGDRDEACPSGAAISPRMRHRAAAARCRRSPCRRRPRHPRRPCRCRRMRAARDRKRRRPTATMRVAMHVMHVTHVTHVTHVARRWSARRLRRASRGRRRASCRRRRMRTPGSRHARRSRAPHDPSR